MDPSTTNKLIPTLVAEIERLKAELQTRQPALPSRVATIAKVGSGNIKILAFSGSLRAASVNAGLVRAACEKVPANVTLEMVDLTGIPLFNSDLEKDLPAVVKDFQEKVKAADAFLFAIPEYNYSMSGPFKNAIDWASRMKGAFSGKVAGTMGAGGGQKSMRAQYHFKQTAVFLDLRVLNKPEVMVNAFEKDAEGKFVNFNLQTGDLISNGIKDRIGSLLGVIATETENFQANNRSTKALNVLALAGSIRSTSVNAGLVRAATEKTPSNATLESYNIDKLPVFNSDLEKDLPAVVKDFQEKVKAADAFLFAIPEYNYSMSGPFKNAIDWASRMKGAFSGKVAGTMGAGGGHGTAKAQYHFRQTAVFLDLRVLNKPEVMVNAFEKDAEGKFVNFNLQTGDLISNGIKDRVGELLATVCDEARLHME